MSVTPKFDNPPVVETVLGVQFPELSGFRCAHFGLYWERIKERFPNLEDKGRLRPAVETFPRKVVLPEVAFRLAQGGVSGRVWYIAEPDSNLIQVQADRFLFNWRELEHQSRYPSYEVNRNVFFSEFGGFVSFCQEVGLDEPSPELCEVTYINHIEPEEDETAMELFGRVFTGLRWEFADDVLPGPETATLSRSFVIPDNAGRLYAQASLARHNKTGKDLIRLEITARVKHPSRDEQEIAASMDLAHECVVNGFASMMDLEIQRVRWRRTQ